MRNAWRLMGILGIVCLAVSSCGGSAGRNCLVIPAQIDLVRERKDAALKNLENKAKQVDRMRGSLRRSLDRYSDLEAEKALLDSLIAE